VRERVSVGMGPNTQDSLRTFVIKRPNEWTVSVRKVGQAKYKFCISALPRFQYYVFSFLMLAKTKNQNPRGFPPRPFLRAGRIQNPRRISKTLVSVLRILSQKIVFAKPSPFCIVIECLAFLLWRNCVSHRRA